MDYELMMNGNVKIGQMAPDFEAMSTYGKINLNEYKGKWLIFFSHPGDFTPVCTTEMIAFARAYPYFKRLNTELLGLSIDSNSSHLAWMHNIYQMTGIVLPFPIVADRSGEIARKYGMISNDVSTTETVRNVYIIDNNGIIRTILIYPLNVGRFIPEILRTVEALQMSECTNGYTPANWKLGDPVIVPMPQTYNELERRVNYIKQNNNGMSWYLSFKESDKKCMKKIEVQQIEESEKICLKNLSEKNSNNKKQNKK